MNHLMIDLESMDTRSSAAIVSIGAVEFNPAARTTGRTFHARINLQSCLLAGLSMSTETLTWWMQQSPEAPSSITGTADNLAQVLRMFSTCFFPTIPHIDKTPIWCNGGSFDFPVLANAYHACKLELPWKFWNERDCRTLINVCRDQYDYQKPPRTSVAHNALDDAIYQAEMTMDCLALLKGKNP